MAGAAYGQLNLEESPVCGSRSVDCFEKLELVGEGTYGQVYMAREIKTGEIVALKKILMAHENEGFPTTAIREIKILKKLQHKNVIKLKEIVTSPGPEVDDHGKSVGYKSKGGIYMVFEYMEHDLTGLAARSGPRFTISQIKCYMKQLLTGLHYCHVNQVLHRDIKGSNLLIDNEGNLKLADFGLARSYSSDVKGNLTNRVVTLWYRPPELLLGAKKYGPSVDMWSVGCIFAELLHGKPILTGKDERDQSNKIYELCGSPDEANWPGASKLPDYSNHKPIRQMKRRVREAFRHFDRNALDLLEKMLILEPSQRISAKDALDAEYFWADPLPCDPKSLPKYESSHEFQTKNKRVQRQYEEMVKRQKVQHPPQHTRLPPVRQSGHAQAHSQHWAGGHNHAMGNTSQAPRATGGPSHHQYSSKPRGPTGGPNRYPPGGNHNPSVGGYYSDWSAGQGGVRFSGVPCPPQARAQSAGGPRGSSAGYAAGPPNYSQNAQYGASSGVGGRGLGNRNLPHGWPLQ